MPIMSQMRWQLLQLSSNFAFFCFFLFCFTSTIICFAHQMKVSVIPSQFNALHSTYLYYLSSSICYYIMSFGSNSMSSSEFQSKLQRRSALFPTNIILASGQHLVISFSHLFKALNTFCLALAKDCLLSTENTIMNASASAQASLLRSLYSDLEVASLDVKDSGTRFPS